MEKIFNQIWPAVITALVGGFIVFMVKQALKGFMLDMQEHFVTTKACDKQHELEAEDREAMRKDIQNHENRLNAA